jgi:serine/threonine protein phosphatase PrpC
MEFDTARVSLIGDRTENQDRAEILILGDGALALVADGMGGHADGALAAETAIAALSEALSEAFRRVPERFDPPRLLAEAIARAHAEVLALGENRPVEVKPGATVVCALVLGGKMWWGHVGDSRAYRFRAGKLLERTRDHSEVEALLEAGKITPAQAECHPRRHVVEHCLGVVSETPPIALSEAMRVAAGDLVLLCSDGLWSQIEEEAMSKQLDGNADLQVLLQTLAEGAGAAAWPHSDNVTAVALRIKKADGN